jgi:hypothetical protein
VLKMRWYCDVCQRENVCDVSSDTHFFGVVLVVTSDHKSISPLCEWTKIRGWPLNPPKHLPVMPVTDSDPRSVDTGFNN